MEKSIALKSLPIHKKIIQSFLDSSSEIEPFVDSFFDFSQLEKSIENKFLSAQIRKDLADELSSQYAGLEVNKNVRTNINLLRDSRTFTITTGHQLNLFTGPLYSLVKICQTISLAKKFKELYPGYNFVPIYWMATEDHDFEEINHVNLFGKTITWDKNAKGSCGEISTDGIESFLSQITPLFSNSEQNSSLLDDLKASYLQSNSLAEAHRKLMHQLIPDSGLVILDANVKSLKSHFSQSILKELKEQVCYAQMSETNKALKQKGFHVQINPREICLFYLRDDYRERITKEENTFKTADGTYEWNSEELEKEVTEAPERFSPNACFRPVYQEAILPNLAYIGGPGEIAYWLQLKSSFQEFRVDFPMLILRNSHLFLTQKQQKIMQESGLELTDVLDQKEKVISKANAASSAFDIESHKGSVSAVFDKIKEELTSANVNVDAQVSAASKNVEKQLEGLNKKILNALKSKNETKLKRLEKLVDDIYPNQVLKERKSNFLELLNQLTVDEIVSLLLDSERLDNPSLIVNLNLTK